MNNSDLILQSCGRTVDYEELCDPKNTTKEKIYHQSLRLGALMHDLGTFAFSHTTEAAYIKFGETTNTKGGKGLQDDHENLGSYIIKNTDYKGGITHILKKYGLDPQSVSDLVKGVDPSILANQILHSEVDCDRMDYLLRDAHYTGLKYGSYDRDYLLYHFAVKKVDQHDILTINYNALRCVEDFLMSRFAWYSQVIRSPRGAKYDAIAEHLCFHFLEKGLIYRYSDLLDMISNDPVQFYQFNDNYFISLVHKYFTDGTLDKYPRIKDMASCLLFEEGAKVVRCEELLPRLLSQGDNKSEKIFKKAETKVEEIQKFLNENGGDGDWLISDLPKKQVRIVSSKSTIIKKQTRSNVLLERDPVKISFDNGDIKLLADVEHSIIGRLEETNNFLPNVFVSHSAYHLLINKGLIEGET